MNNTREEFTVTETEWLPLSPDLHTGEPPSPLSKKHLLRWTLVLEARGIPFQSEPLGRGWLLSVSIDNVRRAKEELRLYEEENRNWPPPLPAELVQNDNLISSLSVLFLVATFHNLMLLDLSPVDWIGLGNAHAGKILDGQWWRLLTALTLHADWLHLLSNLTIGGLFIVWLCRYLGSGLGWSLFLASGLFGNLFNALLQHPDHRAVGASTAVFGTVGILAAIAVIRCRQIPRRRWLLPVASALALLAMLGSSGERTDLGAHFFGFVCGFVLGLGAEYLTGRFGRPGIWFNRFFCLGGFVSMLLAWWMALTMGY